MRDVRPWAMPLGWLYGQVAGLRAQLFARSVFNSRPLPVPVISVGNLTVGGTGKTPLIAYLVRYFQAQGRRVGVISRGYGRKSMGVHRVTGDCPDEHGDEPTMLKHMFPDIEVYVGERRFEAGLKLLENHSVDLLLADDAFQHLWLKRDLDIVVFDATVSLRAYKPLPWGMAREPMDALRRAQAVVITRADMVSHEELNRLEVFIRRQHQDLKVVAHAGLHLDRLTRLSSDEQVPIEKVQGACLVTGVGRPDSVRRWLESQMKVQFEKHLTFADHHQFSEMEVAKILFEKSKEQWVLITAKDAEKWRQLKLPEGAQVAVAHVQVHMLKSEELFCAIIDGAAR